MATFADNSVANFFFHSPWQPKWSQLGALPKGRETNHLLVFPSTFSWLVWGPTPEGKPTTGALGSQKFY